jgi:hypothetical protein
MTVPVIPAWNTIVPVRRVALQIQEKNAFYTQNFLSTLELNREKTFSPQKRTRE